jgi:hypothetical protein
MTLRVRDPPAPTLRSRICGKRGRATSSGESRWQEERKKMSEPVCHKARPQKPEGDPDDDKPRRRLGVWRVAALEFR